MPLSPNLGHLPYPEDAEEDHRYCKLPHLPPKLIVNGIHDPLRVHKIDIHLQETEDSNDEPDRSSLKPNSCIRRPAKVLPLSHLPCKTIESIGEITTNAAA